MNKFYFWHHSLPPLNLKQDLEENLLDNKFIFSCNNSKCEDCKCDSAYVNHRGESAFFEIL